MDLGLGIGWRPELALSIERRLDLGFVELLAESLDVHAPLPVAIQLLRERGVQVVLHGVGLSLGGAEQVDPRRLDFLARLAEKAGACLVSEHICFVRAARWESGHLLPVPRTQAALEVLVENVRAAQKVLPVPLALENIANLVEWPQAEFDEPEFLSILLEETGTHLLLDLANLYANSLNHRVEARGALRRLPLERLAYVHLAGGIRRGPLYLDTHAHPMPVEPVALLAELSARTHVPGAMLERDGSFPPEAELYQELDQIRAALSGSGKKEAA